MANIKIENLKETELTTLSSQELDFVVGGGWLKKIARAIASAGIYITLTIPF